MISDRVEVTNSADFCIQKDPNFHYYPICPCTQLLIKAREPKNAVLPQASLNTLMFIVHKKKTADYFNFIEMKGLSEHNNKL